MDHLAPVDHEFLTRIHQKIDENLANEMFSVEELSKSMNISRSKLHRKLKRLTGKSATKLITEKRLILAREMLKNKAGTAAEIAYKTGFNSPSYFNKVFKKYYKISPGEVWKGKKVTAPQSLKNESRFKHKINWRASIFVLVLLTFGLTLAAVYFFNTKPSRTEISIAILPFDNLSENETTRYFADGVVEDLLYRLVFIKDLKVISRTSSEIFREKGEKTVPEIGKLLGANYVVEGSVQKVEDIIHISIQLIDTKTDNHILSKKYERNLSDFFRIQSEIAGEIASELSLALTHTELEILYQEQTRSIKAFEYYQLGRFYANKRTAENFYKSTDYYKSAIEEDPNYAQAYAGLADNYFLLAVYGLIGWKEGRANALEMIDKALKIEPVLAEPHTVLGNIYRHDWHWEKAEKEYEQAVKINPNSSTSHLYYSQLLSILGKNEYAREHIDKALQLDPFSLVNHYYSARYYYDQEQFDKALKDIKICIDMESSSEQAMHLEYDIYIALNNDSAAIKCFKNLLKITGTPLCTMEEIDSVYQEGGIEELNKWQTVFINFGPENSKAIYYAMAGKYENAMDMLELAMDNGEIDPFTMNFREYKPIRSDPRFMAIRKKMGLPPLDP